MASPQSKNTKKIKNALKAAVRIAVSAALIAILYCNIDFDFVMREIMDMPARLLIWLLVLTAAAILIEIAKWRVLLPSVPFKPFFKAYMYCEFFMLALPGQMFGEAAKIVAFGKYTGRVGESISTVVIDKLTALTALILIGIIGLAFSPAKLPGAFVGILLVCMIGALGFLFSLRAGGVHRLTLAACRLPKRLSPRLENFADRAAEVIDTWRGYLYKPALLFKTFAYGLLLYVAIILQYVLICRQYDIPVQVIDICWIMPVVNVVQSIPISFAGIGVRDASLVTMLGYIGVSTEGAMILAAVLFLMIIFRAIAGAAVVLTDMIKK